MNSSAGSSTIADLDSDSVMKPSSRTISQRRLGRLSVHESTYLRQNLLEPFGARRAAADARLGYAEYFADCASRWLLQMFESPHVAVPGIHANQGILNDEATLGLDGSLRRRRSPAGQMGGQR